ncbi:hypothetical protein ACFQFG_12220 [Methylobacterium persicinum]|nr:hypothetical protein KHHGKMAE_2943 [Methylobacterium persicinum]
MPRFVRASVAISTTAPVLELDVPAGSGPTWVLDTVYAVVRGEPGSQYYDDKIRRCSRTLAETPKSEQIPITVPATIALSEFEAVQTA